MIVLTPVLRRSCVVALVALGALAAPRAARAQCQSSSDWMPPFA
ncbi:MAG TPA: hypothetical protein VGK89_06055 [Candidatus Eisenbacteria bacterium]|jgi:hypothetical protein